MFDFEKLDVYQIVKEQNLKVLKLLKDNTAIDAFVVDQWKKSSLNILLNLVEGTGRMSEADKKHYLMIARGSVYESTAILDLLKSMAVVSQQDYELLYPGYESISKMLLAMYRSYSK